MGRDDTRIGTGDADGNGDTPGDGTADGSGTATVKLNVPWAMLASASATAVQRAV